MGPQWMSSHSSLSAALAVAGPGHRMPSTSQVLGFLSSTMRAQQKPSKKRHSPRFTMLLLMHPHPPPLSVSGVTNAGHCCAPLPNHRRVPAHGHLYQYPSPAEKDNCRTPTYQNTFPQPAVDHQCGHCPPENPTTRKYQPAHFLSLDGNPLGLGGLIGTGCGGICLETYAANAYWKRILILALAPFVTNSRQNAILYPLKWIFAKSNLFPLP